MRPEDYRALREWGRQSGSFNYYIVQEQNRAFDDNAPIDALYERDGKWTCVSDLAEDHPFRTLYNETGGFTKT